MNKNICGRKIPCGFVCLFVFGFVCILFFPFSIESLAAAIHYHHHYSYHRGLKPWLRNEQ